MEIQNINWNYPTAMWFGLNRIKDIQKACDDLNIKNPLIVTDPGILQTDIINKINNSLNKKTKIFSDVKSNPTGHNVIEGIKQFNHNNHDGSRSGSFNRCRNSSSSSSQSRSSSSSS